MVGDHAQRGARGIGGAGDLLCRVEQTAEQVDLVVRVHVLHHGRDALEPHAGVHRGLRQWRHPAVGGALELHEHQVPDLDVAVAVLVGAARRAAGDLGAMVVEDLGAGAAGTGVAHRPEVRLLAQAHAALGGHADLLDPDLLGLEVVLEHRDPELLARQREHSGQELPGEADRVVLEVVAEAEVAEHLEEGVVARGVAHVLEVVVLAAGAHAALRARGAHVGALLAAEEAILELDHAGVGEQQRGIVARHQRTAGHACVALALEIAQEGFPDLGTVHCSASACGIGWPPTTGRPGR